MAGKHTQKGKSNAPLIILIIVAVLVIAAITVGVFWFMNKDIISGDEPAQPETTVAETITLPEETFNQTEGTTTEETIPATEKETGAEHSESKIDVAVPTDDGAEVSYFNATFIPNGIVEDTYTGGTATLREVFGSGYTDGVITFNSDGTFTDTLSSSSVNSGAYAVQNSRIVATYTNDKNMDITVTSWDGDTPAEFYINFGGYNVYFG